MNDLGFLIGIFYGLAKNGMGFFLSFSLSRLQVDENSEYSDKDLAGALPEHDRLLTQGPKEFIGA